MKIGERIKLRRQELNLSVDEVASKLNKDRATVYRYESNKIKKMPITVLGPLAQVLLTTPAYLMGWEDNHKRIKHEVPDELKDLGVDWVMFTKECKDTGLTPEEMKQFLDVVKVAKGIDVNKKK